MNSSFSQEQFDSIYPEGIENHYWNHARNRIIGRLLKKHKLTHGKILEIGCGKGIVIDFLRSRKLNCFGVELSHVVPVAGMADFIFTGTDAFNLPQEFRNGIEIIMILDVIEHFEDPAGFIELILQSYKNIRQVIITVPARPELWTNYDEFNGHFRRYNLSDVIHLTDHFLPVVEAGYFNHLLYPVFLVFAKVLRNRQTAIKSPAGTVVVLHRFLSLLLQLDYWLIPKSIPGTSVIALFSVRRD